MYVCVCVYGRLLLYTAPALPIQGWCEAGGEEHVFYCTVDAKGKLFVHLQPVNEREGEERGVSDGKENTERYLYSVYVYSILYTV